LRREHQPSVDRTELDRFVAAALALVLDRLIVLDEPRTFGAAGASHVLSAQLQIGNGQVDADGRFAIEGVFQIDRLLVQPDEIFA